MTGPAAGRRLGSSGASRPDAAVRQTGRVSLVVRPYRTRRYAVVVAAVVVVASGLAALFLRHTPTGVHFETTDQIGVFGVGVWIGAGIMLAARPRVRADEDGVRVRNLLGERSVPWDLVRSVEFRDGWPWASLDLDGDEVINLMAVQIFDGERAVHAMSTLRDLLAHQRPAPEPSGGADHPIATPE